MMKKELLLSVRCGTGRRGKSDLIKYLTGKTLTRAQAIRAKCYDCNGMGDSNECDIDACSLFPFSPYAIKPSESPQTPVLRANRG